MFAKGSLQNYYGNYTLTILAKDLGSPQNAVEGVIDITVLDFNDHSPYFTSPSSNVTIRVPEVSRTTSLHHRHHHHPADFDNFNFQFFKNATLGTSVIQVKAVDNDVGPNAAVLYRLKQDPSGDYRSFAIDQVTGLITVRSPFDRERQKTYNVRVFCSTRPFFCNGKMNMSMISDSCRSVRPRYSTTEYRLGAYNLCSKC